MKLDFIQIQKGNKDHSETLSSVCIPYLKEINFDEKKHNMKMEDLVHLISDIQGSREDMHLELCYHQEQLIGFAFYAVDTGGIKNILEGGYGYIMEFYVRPQFRKSGYGRAMFRHIETTFARHGAEFMYLTPQEGSGEKFWHALGFADSGKNDPDNHKSIFIKSVS